MTPIHEVLSRIRWDPALCAGEFEVAYLDRVSGTLERVSLAALRFDAATPFGFEVTGADGTERFVPFHRVREVRRGGVVVWRRTLDSSSGRVDVADR